MAPNIRASFNDEVRPIESDKLTVKEGLPYKLEIQWRNVVLFVALHLAALVGLYLSFTKAKWQTIVFTVLVHHCAGLGITAGAHRLWSHRAYKAKWPLRALLCFFNCIAFENDIYEWSRDHRAHHRYSETDADPHNAVRGFFFAHIGWLLCKKHPDVIQKGKTIDFSDLLADPIVVFQRRYYLTLVLICCFILPTVLPMFLWGESFYVSFYVACLLRYCFTLNMTWLVNSAAHKYGYRPYDVNINPRENIGVALGAMGEGYHNYHHTFPWDYSTSELGWRLNLTTMFIDACAALGLAYDLKKVSPSIISKRVLRTGDGSHYSLVK